MDYRHFLAALTALAAIALGAVIVANPTPQDRCRAAGYADAVHILQPDGRTREWVCATYAEFPAVPRFANLKDL